MQHKRDFAKILEKRLTEETPLIQVVLGPRQVGKTTGILQLLDQFKDAHYASADDALIQTRDWIHEQWQHVYTLGPNPILVIDEIQKVIEWSEEIKRCRTLRL
jgi:uncharacterized protein